MDIYIYTYTYTRPMTPLPGKSTTVIVQLSERLASLDIIIGVIGIKVAPVNPSNGTALWYRGV